VNLKIKIILIETSHPGNIGAVARAMKNMGLYELVLVNPVCFPHEDAVSRASGAEDILESATVVSTLVEAIEDCSLVVGASARSRSINWPSVEPRQCVEKILTDYKDNYTAIVFGPEKSGLKNESLDHCNYLLSIPTNPDFSSLNLAMAVQIFCYELRMQVVGSEIPIFDSGTPSATVNEMENFYVHLESHLIKNEFLNPDEPRHLMRRIRRLFMKASPDQNEVNILRGILSSFESDQRKELKNEKND
jgi:tRNA (cytidine32/uridine32-2'-O)-methyltransferase